MDFALVIFWLSAGVSILYVARFGLYLVSINFYDVWQQRPKGKRGVRLPVEYEAERGRTASVLFYIMDLVQSTVALRCIARSCGLFRRPGISTWTSPQPAGSVVVAHAA
ncbi:MAG: hypothetical protein WAL27_04575 [Cellulosimicrobium cellulans]